MAYIYIGIYLDPWTPQIRVPIEGPGFPRSRHDLIPSNRRGVEPGVSRAVLRSKALSDAFNSEAKDLGSASTDRARLEGWFGRVRGRETG